jgi:hypothetical protein
MEITYKVSFSPDFAKEFANFDDPQQDAVTNFIALFQQHGLSDFDKYPGKMGPSWKNAEPEIEAFTQEYRLWHYHAGYPEFETTIHGKYLVSDWVLHFQWMSDAHIHLVDMYTHYTYEGNFYLPDKGRLEQL